MSEREGNEPMVAPGGEPEASEAAPRGGDPEASATIDMGALLEQAQTLQQQLVEAQATAAEQVAEGQSGGGMVKVRVTGGLEFRSVSIDPAVVDPDDVAMLEDLILLACNEAVARGQELAQEAMGALRLGPLGGLGHGH